MPPKRSMRSIRDWIGALIFVAILLRVAFYLGAKVYFGSKLDSFDLVMIPIGLASGYIGYMYLRRIFGKSYFSA
jgi:hypothetical protein